MASVFVLTNNKGGVGKSTSVVNCAYGMTLALAQSNVPNKKVLIIDTDGQGHTTLLTTRSKPSDLGENSLGRVLMANRQDLLKILNDTVLVSEWHDNLHVLGGNEFLDTAEQQLIGVTGAPYRLANAVNELAPHYAAIFIDTRPSFSLMTEMALIAGTDVIIPIEAKFLETVGLNRIIAKVTEVREGWPTTALKVSGIVVTKFDKRARGQREMLEQISGHPNYHNYMMGVIPMNESITYSHAQMQSVFDYDPTCAASHAYGEVVARMSKMLFARSQ